MRVTRTSWILLIAPASILLYVSAWVISRVLPESSPVARGAAYAEVRGCVGCHGDPENPRADANGTDCSNKNTLSWHPNYDVECIDVMAYFETVRLRRTIDERAQFNSSNPLIAGEQLARQYHCFQCHGHLGQGGFANAKSLKGYVPGYFGADFKALTRDADPRSVREWIMHGADATILDTPITGRIAHFFFERQAVSMPSFNSLAPDEIDTLTHYVIALHRFGPMTAHIVRSYGERSQSSGGIANSHASIRPESRKAARGERYSVVHHQ